MRATICAIVLGVLLPPGSSGAAEHQFIFGTRLALHDSPTPALRSASLTSLDPTISLGDGNGSGDDPVLHGGGIGFQSTAGEISCGYSLPPNYWSYLGAGGENKGYAYDDTNAASPIRSVRIKPGRAVKFRGRGAFCFRLDANPAPLAIGVSIGTHDYCMTFGGTSSFARHRSFIARQAPPGGCPIPPYP